MPDARRWWNRCWDKSSRREAFANSCCAASRRSKANGRWCAPRTTSSNCIACAPDRRPSKGSRGEATHHRQPLRATRACSRKALATMSDTQPHAHDRYSDYSDWLLGYVRGMKMPKQIVREAYDAWEQPLGFVL